jgi:hypothetical protein
MVSKYVIIKQGGKYKIVNRYGTFWTSFLIYATMFNNYREAVNNVLPDEAIQIIHLTKQVDSGNI